MPLVNVNQNGFPILNDPRIAQNPLQGILNSNRLRVPMNQNGFPLAPPVNPHGLNAAGVNPQPIGVNGQPMGILNDPSFIQRLIELIRSKRVPMSTGMVRG